MGSASRASLDSARRVLRGGSGAVDLSTAGQLLGAGRAIGGSTHLLSALADTGIAPEVKHSIVDRVFGATVQEPALRVLRAVVDGRWSSHDELLAGIEELGIRAVAISAPEGTPVESELFTFGRAVSTDDGLELAFGDKLGDPEAKSTLVHRLLDGRASEQTVVIVEQLVQQPRGAASASSSVTPPPSWPTRRASPSPRSASPRPCRPSSRSASRRH
ncbi:hypothetical protein MAFF212519_28320 [Clavibacter michiganensis]